MSRPATSSTLEQEARDLIASLPEHGGDVTDEQFSRLTDLYRKIRLVKKGTAEAMEWQCSRLRALNRKIAEGEGPAEAIAASAPTPGEKSQLAVWFRDHEEADRALAVIREWEHSSQVWESVSTSIELEEALALLRARKSKVVVGLPESMAVDDTLLFGVPTEVGHPGSGVFRFILPEDPQR